MRVTLHSTLAISTCALALLSQLPSAHSFGGVYNKERKYPIKTFAQEYVEANHKKLGLSNIYWGGGDDDELSLARVTWNKHDAFMKCALVSDKLDPAKLNMSEAKAFKALEKANKEMKGDYATGRQNVMDPLHQFDFYKEKRTKYFCHLYSFIDGVLLKEYIKKHSISQAFSTAFQILPDVINGLIYLYNAGIIHYDMDLKNVMLQLDSDDKIVGVKIIDLDSTEVFKKQLLWKPINPNDQEYLLPNPSKKYKSCDGIKGAMVEFLSLFVYLDGARNPFDPTYRLTEKDVLNYLQRLNLARYYSESDIDKAKAFIPAMIRLTRAIYTIRHDPFTCTSPMRAFKGLPPRTL